MKITKIANMKLVIVEEVHTEPVAKALQDELVEHGLLIEVKRRSRRIDEEPYVQHTWIVVLKPRHQDEIDLAKRVANGFHSFRQIT